MKRFEREKSDFVFACTNPREGESRASGKSHKKSSGIHRDANCVEDPEENKAKAPSGCKQQTAAQAPVQG